MVEYSYESNAWIDTDFLFDGGPLFFFTGSDSSAQPLLEFSKRFDCSFDFLYRIYSLRLLF